MAINPALGRDHDPLEAGCKEIEEGPAPSPIPPSKVDQRSASGRAMIALMLSGEATGGNAPSRSVQFDLSGVALGATNRRQGGGAR